MPVGVSVSAEILNEQRGFQCEKASETGKHRTDVGEVTDEDLGLVVQTSSVDSVALSARSRRKKAIPFVREFSLFFFN